MALVKADFGGAGRSRTEQDGDQWTEHNWFSKGLILSILGADIKLHSVFIFMSVKDVNSLLLWH